MLLEGKVAIVTGGASGQGKASALLFAKEGATVVIADWNAEGAEVTSEEIRELGGEAMAIHADISNEAGAKLVIDKTVEAYGRLDVLFNNAGIGLSASNKYKMASIVDTPEKDWDAILAINLKGAAMGCKHAIPIMIEQGGGAIINNASNMAVVGMPCADAYTAAKGGLAALSRAMAAEWAPKGVRVNCICPGPIETPMIRPWLSDPETLAWYHKTIPMKRIGQPEEIAQLALFLASDSCQFMTGQVICVDGGQASSVF